MKSLDFGRYVLGSFAAAALLEACGGSQSPIDPSSMMRVSARAPLTKTCPCLYVTNEINRVTVYPATANGNIHPKAGIHGSDTELLDPWGMTLDKGGNIYVTNSEDNSVTVFSPGANGDVAPNRMIKGDLTALTHPTGIALDTGGNIYVANWNYITYGTCSVTVYSQQANGNIAPLRQITGSRTKLYGPSGITVDASGDIYVANGKNDLLVFAAGATGNVAPIEKISGRKTNLNGQPE